MFAYVVNLVENGHCESGLDSSDDLDALLADAVRHGWEDDPDRLQVGALTFTDAGGRIVAVVTWAPVDGQEWPDLLILRVLDGTIERYRRVEREPVYSSVWVA